MTKTAIFLHETLALIHAISFLKNDVEIYKYKSTLVTLKYSLSSMSNLELQIIL